MLCVFDSSRVPISCNNSANRPKGPLIKMSIVWHEINLLAWKANCFIKIVFVVALWMLCIVERHHHLHIFGLFYDCDKKSSRKNSKPFIFFFPCMWWKSVVINLESGLYCCCHKGFLQHFLSRIRFLLTNDALKLCDPKMKCWRCLSLWREIPIWFSAFDLML